MEAMEALALVKEYTARYHQERNHQGKDNRLLFPSQDSSPDKKGTAIACRSRLGGVLKYYYQRAA